MLLFLRTSYPSQVAALTHTLNYIPSSPHFFSPTHSSPLTHTHTHKQDSRTLMCLFQRGELIYSAWRDIKPLSSSSKRPLLHHSRPLWCIDHVGSCLLGVFWSIRTFVRWWGQCGVFVWRELSVMLCLWSLTELFLMSALKLHGCSRPVEVRPLGPSVCLGAAICRSLAHLRVSTTFLFIFSVSGRWSSLELRQEVKVEIKVTWQAECADQRFLTFCGPQPIS